MKIDKYNTKNHYMIMHIYFVVVFCIITMASSFVKYAKIVLSLK
ncbi:MAG: hypothetical protein K0R34_959 [Herbinix sp.]|jgi:hypothetical protein|nr:hypothetical protein [Herbinix sp.]